MNKHKDTLDLISMITEEHCEDLQANEIKNFFDIMILEQLILKDKHYEEKLKTELAATAITNTINDMNKVFDFDTTGFQEIRANPDIDIPIGKAKIIANRNMHDDWLREINRRTILRPENFILDNIDIRPIPNIKKKKHKQKGVNPHHEKLLNNTYTPKGWK